MAGGLRPANSNLPVIAPISLVVSASLCVLVSFLLF